MAQQEDPRYRNTWSLSPGHRAELSNLVEQYLLGELLQGHPLFVGEWDQSSEMYRRSLKKVEKVWTSMCMSPVRALKIHLRPRHLTSQVHLNNEVRRQILRYLTNNRVARLNACAGNPKLKVLVHWVHVYWYDGNNNWLGGHASLLLFDLRNRFQIFFDPADDRDVRAHDGLCYTKAFLQQFVQGFSPVPLSEATFPNEPARLQTFMEKDVKNDLDGQCGVLCLLVLVCCLRFGYFHPRNMANIIKDALDTPNKRIDAARGFVSWYTALQAAPDNDIGALAQVFAPAQATGGCEAYTQAHRLCTRAACKQGLMRHQMCWQHRHIVVNPFAAGGSKPKSCGRAIANRPAPFHSRVP